MKTRKMAFYWFIKRKISAAARKYVGFENMNRRGLDATSVDHVQMHRGHANLSIFPHLLTRAQRKILGGPLKLRVNGSNHPQKQALLP